MTTPPQFGTFFLPGPTEVRAEVLNAMTRPMISHRGREFEQLFHRVQDGLRTIFGTERPVFVGTCSATGFMEAGVRCAPPGRLLALVNGAFSERFAYIAEACGRTVDRYNVHWGEAHDADELAARLETHDYAVVSVVHSETSTGTLNDIRVISDAAHQHGAVCIIDSVSGAGGAELRVDEWNLDYVLTGSQKALALPPGLAFAVASEDFMRRADSAKSTVRGGTDYDRGVYLDLSEFEAFARKHQVPNTPAISLYYALDVQLQAIVAAGVGTRWARHSMMSKHAIQWVTDIGESLGIDVRVLARSGHRSPTVTTVTLPDDLSSSTVVQAVQERGITIGAGYGKLQGSSIRIGHMGDHTAATLDSCLRACTAALAGVRG